MAEARKAYYVKIKGGAIKTCIVYANTVGEANEKADIDRYGADFEVIDTDFWEDRILQSETRRAPAEDRDA